MMNTSITPPGPRGVEAAGQDASKDAEHIRLLSIFHHVAGGVIAFFSCIPFIHIAMGLFFLLAPPEAFDKGKSPPAFVGWFFVVAGSAAVLLGWTTAILLIVAGRFLKRHKRRVFCLVVAGISCLMMPIGTVLGVFTIIVLSRETVRKLFEGKEIR